MTKFNRILIALGIALALPGAAAWAGVPFPTKNTPRAVDAGPVASDAVTTVTVALKLHDPEGARALLTSMYTPGSPNFHGFLTPEQFAARFGPTADEIERVSASLSKFGLSVERAGTSTLHVTGTPSALESAFSVSLHTFSIAAHDHHPGYSYRAPTGAPAVPAEVASLVHSVIGLDTRPAYHPHMARALAKTVKTIAPSSTAKATGNQPGSLTVADFASRYGVTPLYSQGIEGKGRTVGIVTLASFTPSDAFVYWSAVGLKVNSNRITVVNVDGGAGAPSDASGSDETTLDVEQSGGLAPAANVVVYVAPNTNQGFVDAFVKAVDANKADSISTSWGEWEWFDNLENSPVTDPFSGKTVGALHVQNEIFLQAALQGQSMFAAAGDSGAYDVNRFNLPPDYSLALSVDSPASDPYITATGGTTLPGSQSYLVGSPPQTITVDIKHERVWSWDYLEPLCQVLVLDPIDCGIFPVGGGGGVSVFWPIPFYQIGTQGIQRSQPDQAFVNEDVIPPQTLFALPAHYKGRNVPDISANADPDTGYSIYYTSDQQGFIIETFVGGTSFTAPQFNGVTALLDQSLHSRIGLLNVPLYMLGNQKSYGTSASSLKPVTTGNNDFYLGSDGYNPAAGLGTIDASKLATDLGKLFF